MEATVWLKLLRRKHRSLAGPTAGYCGACAGGYCCCGYCCGYWGCAFAANIAPADFADMAAAVLAPGIAVAGTVG